MSQEKEIYVNPFSEPYMQTAYKHPKEIQLVNRLRKVIHYSTPRELFVLICMARLLREVDMSVHDTDYTDRAGTLTELQETFEAFCDGTNEAEENL